MKKLLLILLSVPLLFSCDNKKEETKKNEQETQEEIQTSTRIDTIYADGSQYVGEWKDGKRNGQGTQINANGNKYIGEFNNNDANGQGTYIDTNGDLNISSFGDSPITYITTVGLYNDSNLNISSKI